MGRITHSSHRRRTARFRSHRLGRSDKSRGAATRYSPQLIVNESPSDCTEATGRVCQAQGARPQGPSGYRDRISYTTICRSTMFDKMLMILSYRGRNARLSAGGASQLLGRRPPVQFTTRRLAVLLPGNSRGIPTGGCPAQPQRPQGVSIHRSSAGPFLRSSQRRPFRQLQGPQFARRASFHSRTHDDSP